jgi:glucosamine--fructose-6-phosphate aminotransferase (isomerizing)
MEYRGYDSAGIAIDFHLQKTLKEVSSLKMMSGNIGIGHTRWATHGKPSIENAHPHSSENFCIVHNGIIENFEALKEYLGNPPMSSETDSEIIVHLLEHFKEEGFVSAFEKTCSLLEGAYAIIAASKKEDYLLGGKNGSPLVLGVGKETILASDANAMAGKVNKAVSLEDKDIVKISSSKHEFLHEEREPEEIKLRVQDIDKAGHDYFMHKEICEQPESISRALAGRLEGEISGLKNLKGVNKVLLLACGTSWHACLIAKYYFEHYGMAAEVDYASEFLTRKALFSNDTLAVVVSQSGETKDTLEALKKCKENGLRTFGIVNVVGSTIAKQVDSGMYLKSGPEIGVASTKAFTSNLVCMLLLAAKLSGNKTNFLEGLNKDINQVLQLEPAIEQLAKHFENHALFLGRGILFPLALEGALKMKEISYVHAEGYPAAEMKHGPIALIDEKMPVVIVSGKNYSEKINNNISEIKARGGKVIALSSNKKTIENLDCGVLLPKVHHLLEPIVYSIPLQLLAYHTAVLKGKNVDKPRNLAKSVTVE